MSADGADSALKSRAFDVELHVKYLVGLKNQKEDFESCMIEHMRLSGMYWGVGAMALLGREAEMGPDEIVAWVLECQHPDGGFAGNVGHDRHLLYTLHALLILAMLGALDRVEKDKTTAFIASLQQPDGSFAGDEWLEIDTKFTYCALSALSLLGKLDVVDVPKAAAYIDTCRNFDGGFGNIPGTASACTECVSFTGSRKACVLLTRWLLVIDVRLCGAGDRLRVARRPHLHGRRRTLDRPLTRAGAHVRASLVC